MDPATGETENLNTNYNQLLKQIQNLSELQSSGAIQNADPNLQAAYVARLQQQAAQIKQLLKLLNNTGVTNSTNFSNNTENATNESSKETSSFVPSEINNETGGYEALWELSERTLTNVGEDDETTTEVEEDEDVSGDHEDLYENTGAFSNNFSLSVENPPPLPPRLPSSRPGSIILHQGAVGDLKNISTSEQNLSISKQVENCKTEQFNCASPSSSFLASQQLSIVASTPKDISDVDGQKIQELKSKRAELISSLQSEERERQWHYTQLELISQKIRNIPLTSAQSYSLENELQRQQLEERAARVQSSLVGTLGRPEEALARRRSRVQTIANIDTQLASHGVRMEDGRGQQETRTRTRQPQSCNLEQLYHEALPLEKALSHSGPPGYGSTASSVAAAGEETASVISFTSSVHSVQGEVDTRHVSQDTWRGDACRVTEAANSLMSLLGCTDMDKMSRTLLAMSGSPANCDMMRNSRCIPLLVQLLHIDPAHPDNPRPARQIRARAARALHNIVHAHPSDKHCKREAKVLKLLEVLRQYCDFLRDVLEASVGSSAGKAAVRVAGCRRMTIQVVEGGEKYAEQDLMVCDFGDSESLTGGKQVFACHNFLDYSGEARNTNISINIEETMAILTRCSFDESHRQPIFLLGGIPALAELIQVENKAHLPNSNSTQCREVRRYAVVALTNLTFGNASVKSYLCSFPGFVEIMVNQLECNWENLRKATAHLFRNLAWKADKSAKSILSESKVVHVLLLAAMSVGSRALVETPMGTSVEPNREDESTLKVILSALWNLSAHCKKNKSDVCSQEAALVFLVQLLRSKSTAVVENGGGILRNISSFIATCQQGEDFRKILRDENCLSLLLSQLRSPSLTIVSNACGTLWNFSARSQTDQELLWELGAVPMLQSLTNSKHKTISTCSLAALKNLYTARPAGLFMMVSGAGQTGQLTARKVKNMVADLDEKLSDCGGKDVEGGTPQDSPDGSDNDLSGSDAEDKDAGHIRSESQNSLSSSHSRNSQSRSSRSPDGAGGRKALFLKGIADVAKQNGTSMESLGKSLPSCYSQSMSSKVSQSPTPPPQLSKRGDSGRSSLSAEGRFDSHYTNFMKKPSPEFKVPSLELYLDKDKDRNERVMSPSNLMMTSGQSQDSPSSTPLDLSKKKPKFEESSNDDTEPCEEKPTDYSLRYQEAEEADKETKAEPLFEDAVKTYYTEGTPMDTPFMFSTATSMNDLREPAIAEEDEQIAKKMAENDSTVAYAVEGTPLTFSRAESLSDLEDIESCDNKLSSIPEIKEEKAMNETAGEKREVSKTPPLPSKDSGKTVTFRGAEGESSHHQSHLRNPHETPMMFSRASSIASLDSFDQGSVNDDYSSYEASRATSGRVSPSHLPDSPSQTMPGTPRNPQVTKDASKQGKSSGPPPLAALHKKPMFDDGVKSYQVEGTPAILSTRTSLSGLEFEEDEIVVGDNNEKSSNVSNISDDEDIYADSESLLGQLINSAMPNSKPSKSKLPKPKHAWNKNISESPKIDEAKEEGSDDSYCSEENQDILDACIASAMPTKTKDNLNQRTRALGPRQAAEGAPAPSDNSKSKKLSSNTNVKVPPAPPERKGSHLSHPCVAAAAAAFGDLKLSSGVMTKDQFQSSSRIRDFAVDQPRSYRVEDTPLNFSAATSLSDLTVDDPDLRSGRISVDSQDGLLETKTGGRRGHGRGRSMPASGADTPLRYMTEDTPAVFSRNDSLSSLEFEDASAATESQYKGGPVQSRASKFSSATVSSPGSFQSHLPRPSAVGRSGSSGSSTGTSEKNGGRVDAGAVATGNNHNNAAANKSFNSSLSSLSIESLDNTNADEEDLLADCISSAMPKSKSEHYDLAGKSKKVKKSPVREDSKSSEKEFRRSNSKSPKSSKLKPGVVIPDLKLKPQSSGTHCQHIEPGIGNTDIEKFTTETEHNTNPRMSVRQTQEHSVWGTREVVRPQTVSMEDTLTQSRMSELELASLTPAGLEEAHKVAQSMMVGSDYSEIVDNINDIGPPSIMMDSLPSLTQPPSLAPRKDPQPAGGDQMNTKLPCRHTISAKLGSSVPVAVRRALGGSGLGSLSSEDLSSISSCQSNIDNIAPPSMLDQDLDMENSMLSVASISSEVAAALIGSGASDDVSASLTSEIIRDIVKPAAQAVESFDLPSLSTDKLEDNHSVSHQLESIAAPTILEDITLTQGTVTLKPAPAAPTYIVDDGADTIADVTDAFDEDVSTVEQTLTAGKDAEDFVDIPDLPRDSKGNTPAQSGGESSVETTPLSKRKLSPKERRQADRDRYLTWTKSNNSSPSKKSEDGGQTFRQARLSDDDRFRTRTITKEDLSSPGSSPDKASPKSIKQRRSEEAARYLTHTITPADLKAAEANQESLTFQEAQMLESEARLVVKTITARKAEVKSRSASVDPRSRSASTEILRDHEMTRLDADSCVSSQENLLDDVETRIPGKPRICKPWESRVQQQDDSPQKSVRGRRRALYSPPMKRATVPPQLAPKPTTRPRTSSSPSTSPSQRPRGTRATQLRQASSSTLRSGSGSTSPRSLNSSGSSMISPRSLTSPHLRATSASPKHPPGRKLSPDVRRTQSPGGQERPALVRQGTFTKDDDSTSNSSQSTAKTCLPKPTSAQKKTPPKTGPKPSIFNRKDTIQPSPSGRPTLQMAGTTKTQQLREQSFTRGSTVRSSASSNSSVTSKTSVISRNSMRTSSSSHSLRNAADIAAPKRIPSSSDIERRKVSTTLSSPHLKTNVLNNLRQANGGNNVANTSGNVATAAAKPTPQKKNVTSKIASLWKKVEESKQKTDAEKSAKKYKPKDKRVWMGGSGKGKVLATDNAPPSSGGNLVRSGTYDKINEMTDSANISQSQSHTDLKPRSRSRLSIKLSKFSLKKKSSMDDQYNGNTPLSPESPSDELGNSIQIVSPSDSDPCSPITDNGPADIKLHPQLKQPNHTFKSPQNRSPASAIVAPFNYNPPASTTSGVQLKRNTSYVSSLGRKREEHHQSSEDSDVQNNVDCEQKMTGSGSMTNSAMVTLV